MTNLLLDPTVYQRERERKKREKESYVSPADGKAFIATVGSAFVGPSPFWFLHLM